MAFTDNYWTATITGNVVVECWGAGGAGRGGQFNDIGGGGGGPAYARKAAIAVITTSLYLARVADAPASGNGDNTLFINGSVCFARGGGGAGFQGFGVGGPAGSSVGDVVHSGGDGALAWPGPGSGAGGGGGSGADDSGDGNPGSVNAGGLARPRGGTGGAGGLMTTTGPPTWIGQPGNPGTGNGGGGGGGGYSNPGSSAQGAGTQGAVLIWNMADWTNAATPGTSPRNGAVPLASYGAAVPPFPAPPFNPKTVKGAFVS